jgi:hypothetical protein
MEWTLELVLIALLAATLAQAIRLERALGVLKRERSSLEALVAGFNTSTQQAESGIQRLRAAADGAGRKMEAQIARATELKQELADITERGDRLADRLDAQVRIAPARLPGSEQALPAARTKPRAPQPAATPEARLAPAARPPAAFSPAELELLAALRNAR